MPIQVNKEDKSLEEVCELFGVEPTLFLKPGIVFLRNPERRKKYGSDRDAIPVYPTGFGFKTFFTAKQAGGKAYNLRYYETETPNEVGGKWVPDFEPKRVVFHREAEMFNQESADLALYFFLYSACRESPWARPGWEYSIVDDDAEATHLIKQHKALMDALNAVGRLSDENITLITLGLNMPEARIANTNPLIQRAALSKKAQANPVEFLDNIANHDRKLLWAGMLRLLIKRKAFVTELNFATVQWKWNTGPLSGQVIVNVPTGNDPHTVLLNFIQNDPSAFYAITTELYEQTPDHEKVDDFFKKLPKSNVLAEKQPVKQPAAAPPAHKPAAPKPTAPPVEENDNFIQPDEQEPEGSEEPQQELPEGETGTIEAGDNLPSGEGNITDTSIQVPEHPFGPLPQSYKEALEYLKSKGVPANTQQASIIAKGVADGSITLDNIHTYLKK